MTPTRTLSYGRVSSLQQGDGYSLDSQRERAREYCAFRQWPAPIHFEDGGVSGTRSSRPGLNALLATIQPGDVVLLKDVSRVGRGGIAQTFKIIEDMEARGASLVFLDQNLDTSTPIGRIILANLAGFAEMELEATRERSFHGRLMGARQGHWTHGPVPIGYIRQDKKLAPHPEHAQHIRAAFEALRTRSLRETAAYLNAQGVPNPSAPGRQAGGAWTIDRLHELIRNPVYVGRGVINLNGHVIEVNTPPLVTEDVWHEVRTRPTTQGGTPKPSKYPLTGHIRCPHGAPYNGDMKRGAAAGGTDWRCYTPTHAAKKRYGCKCGQTDAARLEATARQAIHDALTDPADRARLTTLHTPATPADPHATEREHVRQQLSNLATLQVRGAIELEDYLKLRAELKARETRLQAPADPATPADPAYLATYGHAALNATPEELAELLDLLNLHMTRHADGTVTVDRLEPLAE